MKSLFQNPKLALVYAGVTLFGAAMIVGTESSPGTLQQAVDTVSQAGNNPDRMVERTVPDDPEEDEDRRENSPPPPVEFASDEDLIDEAEGFDPNPPEEWSEIEFDDEEGWADE